MNRMIWICLTASVLGASEIDTPSLGWMWDSSTKSIRRIAGLPGSLRNESGPQLPEQVVDAWVSPNAMQWVVALPDNRLARRFKDAETTDEISGSKPEQVLFSPDGRLTALWWESEGKVALWGQASQQVVAKAIHLENDGEFVLLEKDGLLKTSAGNWIGNFGPEAQFAIRDGRLIVAAPGAFILFERSANEWKQMARHEFESIPAFRQIAIESADSVLAVGVEGQLGRWQISNGSSDSIASSGVDRLKPLQQAGFYIAEGENSQLLFALSQGQKLYSMPAPEVR
jgi:hypothetical protein